MPEPLISIIVPCYNQAQYLDECLQSVLDQTYQDWECIIVNDGSPDHTEEVARHWLKTDSRFQYIFQENKGVSAARNIGIKNAKGEWILPLDGDDTIGANYLSKSFVELGNGYDLIYCNAEYFGKINAKIVLPDFSLTDLLKKNSIFCTALFRKNKAIGITYDEKLIHGLEDWDFWISYLGRKNIKVLKLEGTYFYYRIKDVSRNEDIINNAKKMVHSENYILKKHYPLYLENFGNYFSLLNKIEILEKENYFFKKSKVFRTTNKIYQSVNNLKGKCSKIKNLFK